MILGSRLGFSRFFQRFLNLSFFKAVGYKRQFKHSCEKVGWGQIDITAPSYRMTEPKVVSYVGERSSKRCQWILFQMPKTYNYEILQVNFRF